MAFSSHGWGQFCGWVYGIFMVPCDRFVQPTYGLIMLLCCINVNICVIILTVNICVLLY